MAKRGFTPTPEQQAVIDHPGGHLQVIACAGAGKTEAISRRVCALLERGVEPAQIVAFTFTERAAESLKSRITRRIAEVRGEDYLDKLNPMYVGTIHAYCLRMLTDHAPEFGNFDILEENRLAGLLSREYRRLGLNALGDQHWRPIRDFLRNADVMENELLDPEAIRETPFGKCYIEFKRTLFKYRFLSFGLLISAAVKALDRPEVFKRVHDPLRYLIVDEYQDVNPAQEKLIARLAQDPVELCVVADDDQSIYQWRGSNVSHMQEFCKRYKATSLRLSQNRRSMPGIIALANAFSKTISPRLEKEMKPYRKASGPQTHAWAADTPQEEAQTIAETIEKLHQRGYRYKDIAVLYRSVRTSAPPLLAELKARHIPARCGGRTGLFLQPEPAVLGRTYAWLVGFDWKTDRYGQSQPVNFDDLIDEYQRLFNNGRPIPDLREYLQDWKKSVPDTSQTVNLVRDYYRLLHRLGVQDIDPEDPEGSNRLGTLARFSQILADYEHVKRRSRYVEMDAETKARESAALLAALNAAVGARWAESEVPGLPPEPGWESAREVLDAWAAKSKTTWKKWSAKARGLLESWWRDKARGPRVFTSGQDRGTYFYQSLFNYLQHFALDAYEEFGGEETFETDAVDILTVHQAKGLEWPVVFVPALVSSRFPASRAGRALDWVILPEDVFTPEMHRRYRGGDMEERRLFYVAMTRARDMLYLSCFRRLSNNFKPSPFLLDAVGDPADDTTLPLPEPFTPSADEREELPTITFSELAHYEECPLRFRYSSSLGFQPQLVTELGYGRAIHHILRHVAEKTGRKGKVPTAKQIDRIFDNEFYLPFANTAAFDQLRRQARTLVDTYIAKYSDDMLRVWQTERAFELHLDKGIVSGRADVILDREGEKLGQLAIVDYKTANDERADDVHGFQLAIYAAAGKGEGLNVKAAYLHALKVGERMPLPVDNPALRKARSRATALIESIAEGEFPERPEKTKCTACDMRAICKHALCGKYDL